MTHQDLLPGFPPPLDLVIRILKCPSVYAPLSETLSQNLPQMSTSLMPNIKSIAVEVLPTGKLTTMTLLDARAS